DFMESGTPGVKATEDGWLNRALHSLPPSSPAFRAIALGPSLPRILSGSEPAVAINNINDFGVGGNNPKATPNANTFEAMYEHSVDAVLHGTGQETFDAVKMLRSADPAKYKPAAGADYPNGRFGESLKQLAQLIKANLGVQVAFADIGGWDHHVNEGSTQGQIANVLREFSQSLAAFWTDLGDLAEDTVVVTMSEFGRTARENGNRGTDHGHANVMFVMGGPLKGGKVYGRWPGLDQSQLYQGRDLAVTTDFRQVLGEAVYKHLGNTRQTVIPSGVSDSRSESDAESRDLVCILCAHALESGKFLQLNHHVAAFHPDRINGNFRPRIVRGLARLRIPLPSVPWADQFVAFDDALSQRTAAMQANVIHRGDRPIHVGDADDLIATRKFPGFAFGRKLGLRGEFSEHSAVSEMDWLIADG